MLKISFLNGPSSTAKSRTCYEKIPHKMPQIQSLRESPQNFKIDERRIKKIILTKMFTPMVSEISPVLSQLSHEFPPKVVASNNSRVSISIASNSAPNSWVAFDNHHSHGDIVDELDDAVAVTSSSFPAGRGNLIEISDENSPLGSSFVLNANANAHVHHCQTDMKESHTRNTTTCNGAATEACFTVQHKYAPIAPIFDRLHDCYKEKYLEGKKRRGEMSRRQRLHDLHRSGAMRKQVKKISAERGSEMYYRGMMHLLKKERRMAAQHAKVAGKEEPFETKLNLNQMYDYYIILKNLPAAEE
jgi:hypothetical protein